MKKRRLRRHKVILFDSVRKEGIFTERTLGLQFDDPDFESELRKSLKDAFQELKKEKRFRTGAYSVDFHINFESEPYIHRTSLYFVPEGLEPLFNDLDQILNDIRQRLLEIQNKYKGLVYEPEDIEPVLQKIVMNFKREMSLKNEKSLSKRRARREKKLKRSRPIRRYWKIVRKLRISGISLFKARKLYRKATPADFKKILKTSKTRELKRIVSGLKRRKRR